MIQMIWVSVLVSVHFGISCVSLHVAALSVIAKPLCLQDSAS